MRSIAVTMALLSVSVVVVACEAAPPPSVPLAPGEGTPGGEPRPSSAATAGGGTGRASDARPFRFAQRGRGCSPTDRPADSFVFTRDDPRCDPTPVERIVVTYWGAGRGTLPGVFRILGPEQGQIDLCAPTGGCDHAPEAQLSLSENGPSQLRVRMPDGRFVTTTFVLRDCPNIHEVCG